MNNKSNNIIKNLSNIISHNYHKETDIIKIKNMIVDNEIGTVDIKEAFNQINRYQRESFWSGYGLFEYVQVFVISNGTYTKYYSNTTRDSHIQEQQKQNLKSGKKQQ